MKVNIFVVILAIFNVYCGSNQPTAALSSFKIAQAEDIKVGAENLSLYWPLIKDKKVAFMVNQTSRLGEQHLIDSLHIKGLSIQCIFSPEHGFRGTADAGEKISDGKDPSTGIPIISLYGQKKKPTKADLEGVDLVIFDIQDVGARFYTYISSMHYLMEACAEFNVPFMILDRPNPNGHYVDGPVLDPEFSSFVGMHKVPVVHGMTVGEYATMVNQEGWLSYGFKCQLTVIPCTGYTHQTPYTLPIKPSPNLPNMRAIYLYPSLCFFEPTDASIGRGTDTQFQVIGSPGYQAGDYTFTPVPKPGAQSPKHKDETCRGYDLSTIPEEDIRKEARINLGYLLDFYKNTPNKERFFTSTSFFDKLAGGEQLRKQIINGKTEEEIRKSWEPALSQFKEIRQKYLLYLE
ncbi:MAG: DUF1343 domain-containing protein [Saprospiraceae bacterium]